MFVKIISEGMTNLYECRGAEVSDVCPEDPTPFMLVSIYREDGLMSELTVKVFEEPGNEIVLMNDDGHSLITYKCPTAAAGFRNRHLKFKCIMTEAKSKYNIRLEPEELGVALDRQMGRFAKGEGLFLVGEHK